jgi:thiol-disulfide isomerase/thioredoxin
MAFCQRQRTILTGDFPHLKNGDTVSLLVYKYGEYPFNAKELRESYSSAVVNHHFKIDLSLPDDEPYECRLIIPRLRITPNIIMVEKGDSLHLSGTETSLNDLSGQGAQKTNLLRQMDVIWNSLAQEAAVKSRQSSIASGLALVIENSQKAVMLCRNYINKHSRHLKPADRNLLMVYSQNPIWDIYDVLSFGAYNAQQKDTIRKQLNDVFLPFRNQFFKSFDQKSTIRDLRYAKNMIKDYSLRQVAEKYDFGALNDNSDLLKKYLYFKKHYTGLIREKLITTLMLSAPRSNDIAICYTDTKKFITNKHFITALDLYCQSLPGSPAYNFTLLDSNKTAHHLADFKGKVLILDFWFTGCGNCRELTPKLKTVEERFKNDPRVMFISISSDKNIELWKSSLRGGLYTTSPDELNLFTNGHGMSDPLYKKTNTYSAPTLKLIDANGNWCENPIDCRFDDGKDLTAKIGKALSN